MFPRHQIPNAVTIGRIALIPPIVWLLALEHYVVAVVLLAIAGLSDALDGWLVRRYGWHTRLGAWLDPAADKLLMLGVYVAVTLSGLLPVWLLVLVVGRDVWLTVGSALYRVFVGPLAIRPLLISKVNTFLQITLVLVAIVKVGLLALDPIWVQLLVIVVAFTTVASGLAYTVQWGFHAWRHLHGHTNSAGTSGRTP
ncbi:CDP-alcohol phosphatidyltransferase family protein [Thioalkalivibrio sp. ALMg11]|uniref:CDP-alcohol phosphatidyltransferase family protein n=1 Tax=Thioalkalivibrio sp. ALMg11 TaxID=1158165 RepID=UPI000376099C|nr:CDP-alcohol phosphatidyltransferase family protein [Thioalkalivibrio sp. ALMg11]